MGVARQCEPWNWDLWNTPQERDDGDYQALAREKLDEALYTGLDKITLADKPPRPNP
jgi:hypothetical protein